MIDGVLPPPSAVAIGNFDGVHRGHQALLAELVRFAKSRGLIPAVLTFDPHPTAIVAPGRVPLRICSLEERVRLVKALGIQLVSVLPFTSELALLSPREFIQQIIVNSLNAKAVFVGENFRFGHKKSGDCETLKSLGNEWGFTPHCISPISYRGEVVSSTAIRKYIETQRLSRANGLLGRCFSLSGPVVSGHGVGSRQTVPTLNLNPPTGQVIPRGVYVTETHGSPDSRTWQSITNVGNRPTFNGGNDVTVETFLLSTFEPPAPAEIVIEFRRFVRPERQFPGPEALKAQILRDVAQAQAYWRRVKRWSESAASLY